VNWLRRWAAAAIRMLLDISVLRYDKDIKAYTFKGPPGEAKKAGLKWSKSVNCWYTESPFNAFRLRRYGPENLFKRFVSNFRESKTLSPMFQEYEGLYPFQSAGVEYLLIQYAAGRRYLLLADDPGCGKSPTAAVVAKEMGAKKILIICTASLRLNWNKELIRWVGVDAQVHKTGKQKLDFSESIITSYALCGHLSDYNPDFIIIDECHNLRSATAKRTKAILGYGKRNGIISKAPAVLLSGTPIPNGRPNELFPILSRCAPDIIDYLKFDSYIKKFCKYYTPKNMPFYQRIFTGGKNLDEFRFRLRSSGFMLRREKSKVLPFLPAKRFKLVTLSPTGAVKRVIKKEKQFNPKAILEGNIPPGAAFPEVRKEMGIMSAPIMVDYVKSVLEEGIQKVIVFVHHREVIKIMEKGLKSYNPVAIDGTKSLGQRQKAVDQFQNDPDVRVFLGNEAAEEGITLTASQDVILAEPEFVPGKEAQRADRAHRIGQTGEVLVHMPVIEGTVGAAIMVKAIEKQSNIDISLDHRKMS
jgi:SWI/SNF-related matrix-associated actin-dependent regulator of chromatin subfamily A-like protein 1